jgi:hypothetical protein
LTYFSWLYQEITSIKKTGFLKIMLIESYVIGFGEFKRCISSLRPNDFLVVSENIFMLREKASHIPQDLLTASTPENHPEALLIINKHYAKDLIMDSDAFAFRKPSNDVPNLAGVTLHLSFAGSDLIEDLMALAKSGNLDGIPVKTATMEAILLARQNQKKRFEEHQEILKKSVAVYHKDM